MSTMSTSPQRKERSAVEHPLPVLWAQLVLGLPRPASTGPPLSAHNDAADEGPSIPPGVPPDESVEPSATA